MNEGRLDGKQVFPLKLIAIMSSPHAEIPGWDQHYGYGLLLSTSRGMRWVEHGGSRAGYGSTIRMAPDRKFAVIVVANRSGSGMPKLVDAISEAMLPLDAKSQPEPAAHPLDAAELRRCAGVYVNGSSNIALEEDGWRRLERQYRRYQDPIQSRRRQVPTRRRTTGKTRAGTGFQRPD
jgi:CubicO group peptidase (beta-lactamase class C family)